MPWPGILCAVALLVNAQGDSISSDRARPTVDLSQAGNPFATDSVALHVAQRAQAIDPEIRGSCTFDSSTGVYTYSYSVWNKPGATNTIWQFALAPVPRPDSISTPSEAWDYSYGFDEKSDALVWTVTDAGAAPADWDSVSLWPSPWDIQPGDSLGGFSFTTRASPSLVSYFVQGFYSTPPSEEEGSGVTFTLFQNSLTGTVIGPASDVGGPRRRHRGNTP